MDIWKGAFLGLSKHRDGQHDSLFEHLKSHGAVVGFRTNNDEEFVDARDFDEDLTEDALLAIRAEAERLLEYWLGINPITGLEFENPELYYALVVTLGDKDYDYFIPSPGDGLTPSAELISDTVDAYVQNYVEGRYDLILDNLEED